MNQKTNLAVLFRALRCGIGFLIAKKGPFGAWLGFSFLCCIAPVLSAATTGTFGNFSYSDDGTSITITAYPGAAVGAVDIPSTINGEPVTSIGYHAFSGCSGLTSVTIPAGVTSIETTAFDGCSGLTSVTIPPSVTRIGYAAFNGCGLLTSITIPAGVTIIEKNTFSGCSGLTSMSIPSSVASIGDYAFNGCSGLTSVTISVGVISIGSNAFANCSGLTTMSIPSSVTSVGNQTFSGCSGLTSVTIPGSVTGIGYGAFFGCSGLTSVTIPGSVTSIGDYAFNGCSGLTSVTISVGVISIGSNAFNGCSGLASVTIPSSVTSIGSQAFYGCIKLTSVTIPGSVTSIGSQAFLASGLSSVTLSAGFNGLTDGAFLGCSRLTSVTIPSSVTSIGAYAFDNCSGLTSVTIPSSVTSIGAFAFFGCTKLTGVTIPAGVTSIGDSAFASCSGLTSITIPAGVTSIGSDEFDGCSGLTSVTIPSSVTSIGFRAFYGCAKLTSVTIPAGVTSIAVSTFSGCSGLTSVTIPSSVTSIEFDAFDGCTKLTSVTIPGSVTSIGDSAFFGCSGLTSVTIPAGITRIGNYTFSGCSGLTGVTIPSSVASIGNQAFCRCSGLTSVTIPSSVTSIESQAFYICTKLTSATFIGNAPVLGSSVFASVASGFKVYYLNSSSGFTSPTWQGYPTQVILTQTITFGPLSGKTYGNAPFTLSATASSGLIPSFSIVSGPATISGNTVTLMGVGTVVVRAAQAGNTNYIAAPTVDQSFTVDQAMQTITFGALPGKTYGNTPFTLSATASSGLTPTYSIVSGPATISGGTVTITGVGTVVVRVSQSGNSNYNAATDVDQSFTVAKASATVNLGSLSATYDGTPKAVTAITTPGGLTVIFTYDTSGTAPTVAGSYAVIGTISDGSYQGTASGTLVIAKASQIITFGALASKAYGDTPFTVEATAGSGLTPAYSIESGPATISGNTVTIAGAGTVVVRASQSGNGNYNAATDVDQSFTVAKAAATVTLANLNATYDGSPKSATATTTPNGLTVTFTYDASGTVPAAAGSYEVVGTISDSNYQGSASGTLVITKANSTIKFGVLGEKTCGDPAFTVNATSSSGLTPTYSIVSGPATISGNTVTITGVGMVVVRASQAGDENDNAAADVDQSFTVAKGIAIVTLGSLSTAYDGSPKSATATTTPSGLTVTFTYDASETAPAEAGNYAVVGTISDSNYQGAASGTLVIAKASQMITFGSLASKIYGDMPFSVSATASSGLTPVYTIVSGPATISGNTVTITGTGTVVIRASQDGSSLFAAATPVDQTFTVAKFGQTITFTQPADHIYKDIPFALSATADSDLPVTFSVVSGPATLGIDGKTLSLTGTAGTVTVRASQAGNDNYLAVSADRSFTVFKPTKPQTIKFTVPTAKLMGVAPFDLVATATSGMPVTFAVVSGPATLGVNEKTLTVTGAGTVVLQATQIGDAVYLPAKAVQASFKVSQTAQKIIFKPVTTALMTSPPLTLVATSSSGLPVSFVVVSGPATLGVDGKTLTFTGAGSVVVRATQSGNAVYLAAPAVQATIKVSKATQAIAFTLPTTVALNVPPLILTATSSSGLSVNYVVTGPATLSGQTLTLTGVGTVSVSASQAGNAIFLAAKPVVKKIKVSAAVTKAKSLVSESTVTPISALAGDYEVMLLGTEASSFIGLPVGTLELKLDSSSGQYTSILTFANEADPLFIAGTVEVAGTTHNPIFTGYWEDPTGTTTVQFSISGDGVVASVSKAGQIIAETEAGVVAY